MTIAHARSCNANACCCIQVRCGALLGGPRRTLGVVLILAALSTSIQGCATPAAVPPPARSAEPVPLAVLTEPIPLESADPRDDPYLSQLRQKIKEKWGYPCVRDTSARTCDYKTTKLVIVVSILQDGRVAQVTVKEAADHKIMTTTLWPP